MNALLALLVALLPAAAFAYENAPAQKPGVYGSAKNVKCPIEVKPGAGLGPIALGNSLEDIHDLGLDVKTVQGSAVHMIAGKFGVGVDGRGKVRYVGAHLADLPDCVFFGKSKIQKKTSARRLAKLFPGCQTEVHAEGGDYIPCRGIVIGTGGTPERRVALAVKVQAP